MNGAKGLASSESEQEMTLEFVRVEIVNFAGLRLLSGSPEMRLLPVLSCIGGVWLHVWRCAIGPPAVR